MGLQTKITLLQTSITNKNIQKPKPSDLVVSFSTGGLVVQVRDLLERAVDVGLVQPSATVVLRMVTPTGGATAMDLRVVPKVR